MIPPRTVIAGGGVFGLAAALELRARGHEVTVVDQGPVPHPLAASTDISKVIRMEYGADEGYMALMEEARDGWLVWNREWREQGLGPLYHETGVLMVCRAPMAPGGFEHDSWRLLLKRGHSPERTDRDALARRFPAWATGPFVDGFYHAHGGYAESGRVIEALAAQAVRQGVTVRQHFPMTGLIGLGGRATGIASEQGEVLFADHVVLAVGAWIVKLLPELEQSIRVTGHPVFHLLPRRPKLFAPEWFPVFTADIAKTGYYGFPLGQHGVVKVANHGPGVPIDPNAPRAVSAQQHEHLRAFLAETFPGLADADVISTRLCLYDDTQDGDFWIARDPVREGVTVAGGGSGHGFKFAPVLGSLIADAVEERDNHWLAKFRWRPEVRLPHGREAARWHGSRGRVPGTRS